MPVLPDVASTIVVRPGLDPPLGLGRLDHRDADAVLDDAARVERLELAEQLDVAALRAASRVSCTIGVRPTCVRNVDRDSRHARASLARHARGAGIGAPRATGGRTHATDGFSLHIPYCSGLGGAAWNRRCTTHLRCGAATPCPPGSRRTGGPPALRPGRPPPPARRRRRAPPAPTAPAAGCRGPCARPAPTGSRSAAA